MRQRSGKHSSKAREKDINLAVTSLVGKYIQENMPDVEVMSIPER